MAVVKPLNNMNSLKGGLSKKWIWQWGINFSKSCDYLQKINYCIQDLNYEISNLDNPTMKEVIYCIVLIDWIREAVNAMPDLLIEGLKDNFIYFNHQEINDANKYFKAIRSFAVAHPLLTNQHKKYGFGGDKICVDIRSRASAITRQLTSEKDWYHLDFNGLTSNAKTIPSDFFLLIYSSQNNMEFFKYVGVNFSDLFHVAELQIDMLYALDKYLKQAKIKEWK